MAVNSHRAKRRWTWCLLIAAALVLCAIVARYLLRPPAPADPPQSAHADEPAAAATLHGVHHTAFRNGREDWRLEAETVDYFQSRHTAVISGLTVTFTGDAGADITLTADAGTWHTQSNDLEVSGGVVVENDQYRLETDRVRYAHDRRLLDTRSPVLIQGGAVHLTADGMVYDLATNRIYLNGHVKGIIGTEIAL